MRKSFSTAANVYDGVAKLQREVADTLLAGVSATESSAAIVADIGAGTGYCTRRLRAIFPESGLVSLDLAEGMLNYSRKDMPPGSGSWLVCADAEHLPLADRSVDLLFSNLALQWCSDIVPVFNGFHRVLKRGGRLAFSTFGPHTLQELRWAWEQVDDHSHVLAFQPLETIRSALIEARLTEIRLCSEVRRPAYPSVYALMRELQSLGAHNVTHGRPRHLTGKRAIAKMVEAYQSLFETARIDASFEIIVGHATRV